MKNLHDKGYINENDFSSSVTGLRQDLYAGKVAILPSNVSMIAFVKDEKPADEMGFIGYQTRHRGSAECRWRRAITVTLRPIFRCTDS